MRNNIDFLLENTLGKFKRKTGGIPKLGYLHIPKTGGIYIWQLESGSTAPVIENVCYLGHELIFNKL